MICLLVYITNSPVRRNEKYDNLKRKVLNPWRWVIEKLIVGQLAKKCPPFTHAQILLPYSQPSTFLSS
jgi:hypothetical protein